MNQVHSCDKKKRRQNNYLTFTVIQQWRPVSIHTANHLRLGEVRAGKHVAEFALIQRFTVSAGVLVRNVGVTDVSRNTTAILMSTENKISQG